MKKLSILFFIDNLLDNNSWYKLKERKNFDEIISNFEVLDPKQKELIELELQNYFIPKLIKEPLSITNRELMELLQKINNNLILKQRELIKKNIEIQNANHNLMYDSLTSYSSKYSYLKKINYLIYQSPYQLGVFVLLELLDIADVKMQYGNRIGDKYVLEFSERLANSQSESMIFIRLSEEKFAIYKHGYSAENTEIFERLCKNIQQRINLPFNYGEIKIPFSVCAGGAIRNIGDNDVQTIANNADKALYWAKKCGINNFKCYE